MDNILIPRGDSKTVIKQRERIITDFYHEWRSLHQPYQRIYNVNLKDYINIRQISMIETVEHAAKSYLSTLAVLQLDSILRGARKIKSVPIDRKTKNQAKYDSMIIMGYYLPAIGDVKLTVAVTRKTNNKVQYCITAMESETRKAPH